MSRPAQVDVVVERQWLQEPLRRRAIRRKLYDAAQQQLGRVDEVLGYVVDPGDGPYRDSAWDQLDRDRFAVVRMRANVTPKSPT